jgi:hypothetical protein
VTLYLFLFLVLYEFSHASDTQPMEEIIGKLYDIFLPTKKNYGQTHKKQKNKKTKKQKKQN